MLVSSQINQVNYMLGQPLAAANSTTKYVSDTQILLWLQEAMEVICVLGKVWDTYCAGGLQLATSTESYAVPTTVVAPTGWTAGATVAYTAVADATGVAEFTTVSHIAEDTYVRVVGPVYSGDFYTINVNETGGHKTSLTTVLGNTNYALSYIGGSTSGTRTMAPLTVTDATTIGVECIGVVDVRMQTAGESLTKTDMRHRGKMFTTGTAPIWWWEYANRIWVNPVPTSAENGLLGDVFFIARPTGALIASGAAGTQIDGTAGYPIPFPDKWHHLMPLWAAIKGKMVYRLYDEAGILTQAFAQQLGVSVAELKANLGLSAE